MSYLGYIIYGSVCFFLGVRAGYNAFRDSVTDYIEQELRILRETERNIRLSQLQQTFKERLEQKLAEIKKQS